MIHGHGDDRRLFPHVRLDFSSCIYEGFAHDALLAHLRQQLLCIASYPTPEPNEVERLIAQRHGLSPDWVMATAGATQAIYLIAQAYSGRHSLIQEPTFAEYADACRMHRHAFTPPYDLAWHCSPNNPTGELTDVEAPLVVTDQSYALYTDRPMSTTPADNQLIIRSLTKDYGVPGLRLGYLMGHPRHLAPVRALRQPWSLGALEIAAAEWLITHPTDIPAERLCSESRRVSQALSELIDVHPSCCHILLCQLPHGTAAALKAHLCEQGILIRDASNFAGLGPRHFRLAVHATPSEHDALVSAISTYLRP